MLHLNIHGFVSFHGTLVRELLRSELSLDFICHLAWICECAAHSGDIKSRFFSSLGMVSTTFVFFWCRSNTHYLSEFMTTFFRVELECQYLRILLSNGNFVFKIWLKVRFKLPVLQNNDIAMNEQTLFIYAVSSSCLSQKFRRCSASLIHLGDSCVSPLFCFFFRFGAFF